MTIFCLKNVVPDLDPQKNADRDADRAQKQSIFSKNGLFLSWIWVQMRIQMQIQIWIRPIQIRIYF